MKRNSIFILTTEFLLPFLLLFAIYIQINGEISPGGGFQFGAIFAAIIMVLDLTKGFILPINILCKTASFGVMIYLLTGIVSLSFGKNFLDYEVFAANNHLAQLIGITLVEAGVGITVASSLCLIYYAISKNL